MLIGQHEEKAASLVDAEKLLSAISRLNSAEKIYTQWNSRTRFLEWSDGMRYKVQTTAIPNGIARICNAVACPAGRFKNRVLEFRWVYQSLAETACHGSAETLWVSESCQSKHGIG